MTDHTSNYPTTPTIGSVSLSTCQTVRSEIIDDTNTNIPYVPCLTSVTRRRLVLPWQPTKFVLTIQLYEKQDGSRIGSIEGTGHDFAQSNLPTEICDATFRDGVTEGLRSKCEQPTQGSVVWERPEGPTQVKTSDFRDIQITSTGEDSGVRRLTPRFQGTITITVGKSRSLSMPDWMPLRTLGELRRRLEAEYRV